jgi:hypothetical protein
LGSQNLDLVHGQLKHEIGRKALEVALDGLDERSCLDAVLCIGRHTSCTVTTVRLVVLLLGFVCAAFVSTVAHAQGLFPVMVGAPSNDGPPPPPPPPPPPTEARWYGYQTLIADTVVLGAVGGAIFATDTTKEGAVTTLLLGAVGFGLSGPVIHLAHGRVGAAAGTLALRIAVPVLVANIGAEAQDCSRRPGQDYGNCGTGGFLLGALVGGAAVAALDAVALGWEHVAIVPTATRHCAGLTAVVSF